MYIHSCWKFVSSLTILIFSIILLFHIKWIWPLSPTPGRKTKSISYTWVYTKEITQDGVCSPEQRMGTRRGRDRDKDMINSLETYTSEVKPKTSLDSELTGAHEDARRATDCLHMQRGQTFLVRMLPDLLVCLFSWDVLINVLYL